MDVRSETGQQLCPHHHQLQQQKRTTVTHALDDQKKVRYLCPWLVLVWISFLYDFGVFYLAFWFQCKYCQNILVCSMTVILRTTFINSVLIHTYRNIATYSALIETFALRYTMRNRPKPSLFFYLELYLKDDSLTIHKIS